MPILLGSAARSSFRDMIPSFAKTLRRCHSTVRGLRNKFAAISELDRPSLASRAICASCGVSSSSDSTVRLRMVSPVANSSRRVRSANASSRSRKTCRRRYAAALARQRAGPRGGAIPVQETRAGEVRPELGPAQAIDSLAIPLLGGRPIAQQRSRARLNAEAQSVPEGRVTSISRSSASRASPVSPARAAASTSSGSAQMDGHG